MPPHRIAVPVLLFWPVSIDSLFVFPPATLFRYTFEPDRLLQCQLIRSGFVAPATQTHYGLSSDTGRTLSHIIICQCSAALASCLYILLIPPTQMLKIQLTLNNIWFI